MFLRSRLATWQVLAIVVITLGVFGSPALQAKQKEQKEGCGCQHKECPAPVLEKPTVSAPCCPAPVVREKPCAPPAPSCCPVDPKDVHKAEKANEHAQHEAAEACKRQQKAAAEAQRKIDAAYAHGTHEVDEATAKVNQRYSEWTEEYAKLNSLNGPGEATAETQPQPESEIRTKPEPTPEATPEPPTPPQVTPAPAPEVTPTPAPEVAPPAPMPEATREKPKELPKTASPLDLIGFIGLVSMSGGYLTRFFRR